MWVLTCRAWLIWKVKVLSQNSHKIVLSWCRASIWLVRRCFDVNDLLQCKHGYADFHSWTVLTCLCTFDFFENFFWQIAHCFEEEWLGSSSLIYWFITSFCFMICLWTLLYIRNILYIWSFLAFSRFLFTVVNSGSDVCFDLQRKDLRWWNCKTEHFRWYCQTST